MKRIIAFMICISLMFSVFLTNAAATDTYKTVAIEKNLLEDGSYYITVIQVQENSVTCRGTSTKNGTKSRSYYSATDELQFTVSVWGSFTYNGTTATATDSSSSYSITNSSWSFVSGRSFAADNRAVATCTFHLSNVGNKTYTVTLSCSPTGVLS